mgnify:FL=1
MLLGEHTTHRISYPKCSTFVSDTLVARRVLCSSEAREQPEKRERASSIKEFFSSGVVGILKAIGRLYSGKKQLHHRKIKFDYLSLLISVQKL